MTLPKKGSPEAKAWGEKMRAARAAKQSEQKTPSRNEDTIDTPQVSVGSSEAPKTEDSPAGHGLANEFSEVPESISQDDDLTAMKRRLAEMEGFIQGLVRGQGAAPGGPQVSQKGVVGTLKKYSVNPQDYPDPRDRLFEESRLSLKGFNRDWWDLRWTVKPVQYDTKDGIHVMEPKFVLEVIRIIEHPETGEPSSKRYVLAKLSMFEDPDAALQVAGDMGMEVPEEIQKDFLDEMRYLRVRDWAIEQFYPPKPIQPERNKKEMVINNRLVEVFEANSPQTQSIPFKDMKKARF